MSIYKTILRNFIKKREEIIPIFNINSNKQYYVHSSFLLTYTAFAIHVNNNKDYPEFLQSSMRNFAILCSVGLMGIYFFSRRHVKTINLNPTQNLLTITTHGPFGLRPHTYQLGVKNIKEFSPISKYIYYKKSGVYVIFPDNKTGNYFKHFNFFFIRPVAGNPEFDKIFKVKLNQNHL